MKKWISLGTLLIVGLFSVLSWSNEKPKIIIGSKPFTEGYLLGDIATLLAEDAGEAEVIHKKGFGGTAMVFGALKSKEIQLYPDYTGTISHALLKNPDIKEHPDLVRELAKTGMTISQPLGFNNTYAYVVPKDLSQKLGITKMSELKDHPEIRAAVTHEILKRKDGFYAVMDFYGAKLNSVKGIEHNLAYVAMENGDADLTDAYSTDAEIEKYDLVALEDDKNFFPIYKAVFVTHLEFKKKFPKTWEKINSIANQISEKDMIALNAQVALEKKPTRAVAEAFLKKRGFISNQITSSSTPETFPIWKLTYEHLFLVMVSVLFAILIGIPLGILAWRFQKPGQVILAVTGLLQTIPSLALLCFLIPLFGIGTQPALIALFLYGLLPIVRSTHSGLESIEAHYIESARTLGLRGFQLITQILIPMSSVGILSGIKTSVIINVGTATLAAFIGAGGYGTQIVTGLALNDTGIILQGAVPAALMAILFHIAFEWIDRIVISPGLRITRA